MLLDDKDLDVVTVRAEVSRLRRVIGSTYIESRPYRLLAPVASDMGDVFDALQAGNLSAALDAYSGGVVAAIGLARHRAAAHRTECQPARSGAGRRGPAAAAAVVVAARRS